MNEDEHPRIWTDPARMAGAPCIRGTRVTVRTITDLVEVGVPIAEILEDYPYITEPDIIAALAFKAAQEA